MAGEQMLYNRPLPGARLNMAHPLSKGLVGCWLLNENGGMRAMDLSPYGNHGLLTGFNDPPKRPFNGLPFDGLDDYVDTGNMASLDPGTDSFSIEAWAKNTGAVAADLVTKEKATSPWNGYTCGFGVAADAGRFGIYIVDLSSNIVSIEHTADYRDSTWHHFAATVVPGSATGVKLYVGGVLVKTGSSATIVATLSTTANLFIGKFRDSSGYFKGPIGVVRIYNRALTEGEIKVLHSSPYRPMGLPLFI